MTKEELQKKKQDALDMVEAIYYTPTSPHYKDNERYAWAVKTINEKYNGRENDESNVGILRSEE